MLRKGNPVIVDAIEEGIPLYTTHRYRELVEEYKKLVEKSPKEQTQQ